MEEFEHDLTQFNDAIIIIRRYNPDSETFNCTGTELLGTRDSAFPFRDSPGHSGTDGHPNWGHQHS